MVFTLKTLWDQVAAGEDSTHQFKRKIDNADALAADMAAFANTNGGVIFVGVQEDGTICGMTAQEVRAAKQLINDAASLYVCHSLEVQTQNILLENGNEAIALIIPEGMDNPYFDRDGVIWVKTGVDKRPINSSTELRRLFQDNSPFHADALPTKVGIDSIDRLLFRDFLRKQYDRDFPDSHAEQLKLLQDMNLATSNGNLNVAGVLLFAEQPQLSLAQSMVQGINADYCTDIENIEGSLSRVYKEALAFIMLDPPHA